MIAPTSERLMLVDSVIITFNKHKSHHDLKEMYTLYMLIHTDTYMPNKVFSMLIIIIKRKKKYNHLSKSMARWMLKHTYAE